MANIYDILKQTGLPCVYSHFREKKSAPKDPPYIAYIGAGQRQFEADDTYYHTENQYQIEYYFKLKDEAKEAEIEALLLDNGLLYEKSDDTYIEGEGVFVIYYTI